jgi:hypothetical protein
VVDPCAEALSSVLKDAEFSKASLKSLHEYVECKVQQEIKWYSDKKAGKAFASRTLRLLTIAFSTLGGLVPLLQASGVSSVLGNVIPLGISSAIQFGQVGYLFIGLAAGSFAFDKFFGYSSGWIRYLTTMLSLQRALEEFRLDWLRLAVALDRREPTAADFEKFLGISKSVIVSVRAQVEQETQAWATEFQSALQMLGEELSSKASKAKEESQERAQAIRPGAISLTITNGDQADDGVSVQIDNSPARKEHGTKCEFVPVLPGDHPIRVMASIGGQRATASEIITVRPGEITRTSVTLAKAKEAGSPA